ncbi:MFS transporter [Paenibacillus antri]|uniref:MFS transporter n=1 Tax=Paenibacillus antri TaxID=2582848 RepID=A0A5R9G3R8_9BACL|nr:MFS transporter [Paenibacillus antri]TLS48946.1 MFS transporter [Paenibacillus antri]
MQHENEPIRTPLWTRNFVAVCLSNFFLFMTFYIYAVTLPLFVTQRLGAAETQVGLVMTAFILTTVLFRPLAGKWMDRYDRKKLFAGSLLLFAVCALLYPAMHHFGALIGLRLAHGVGFGLAATAGGAVAAELVPDRRKGEGIGYFSLFMSLAMVVGPFVGLTIADRFSLNAMFLICIAFSALSLLCGLTLRLPQRPSPPATEKPAAASSWRGYIEPAALPVAVASAFLAFAYGSLSTFLSVYAVELHLGSYASYFFAVFAAMIVLTRPMTGRWFDRFGANALVYPGIFLFAAGMIALSFARTPTAFLGSGAVIGLGFGALLPSLQTLAIQSAPRHRAGLATGTFFLLFDAGYGAGSFALGVVAARAGYDGAYLVGGLVSLVMAGLYYLLVNRPSGGGVSPRTAE